MLAVIGSNNLTVGGTETNLESHVRIDLDLPSDQSLATEIGRLWDDAVSVSKGLDRELLAGLIESGSLGDESTVQTTSVSAIRARSSEGSVFPELSIVPPSPIPRTVAKSRSRAGRLRARSSELPIGLTLGAQALVIQISPHHNNEVLLSKQAVDQDPSFFTWPFSGRAVPKKTSNPPYPQRTPDPVVDLKVYNGSGSLIVHHENFGLNTVLYEKKSELRITVPPDVGRAIPAEPPYAIMMMEHYCPVNDSVTGGN